MSILFSKKFEKNFIFYFQYKKCCFFVFLKKFAPEKNHINIPDNHTVIPSATEKTALKTALSVIYE